MAAAAAGGAGQEKQLAPALLSFFIYNPKLGPREGEVPRAPGGSGAWARGAAAREAARTGRAGCTRAARSRPWDRRWEPSASLASCAPLAPSFFLFFLSFFCFWFCHDLVPPRNMILLSFPGQKTSCQPQAGLQGT